MRLVLTIGDPNGIGPEVLLKALADDEVRRRVEPVVVGDSAVLRHYAARLELEGVLAGIRVEDVSVGEEVAVHEGRIAAAAGEFAMAAVARACDMCLGGEAEAMVTAPISKEAIRLGGHAFPGHSEYLAERTGAEGFVMLMVAGRLRVAVATTHIPIEEVPRAVTGDLLVEALIRLASGLHSDFGLERPRIALLGLNPHAGDGGVIGTEEIETLTPAIERARQLGIEVSGPHPADGFFGQRAYEQHDAVLACYHDQGLVPFKALAMGRGVNVTLGLPIVRTSPDHGTAFAIAGQGVADPSSFIAAVELAAEIAERRKLNVQRAT